MAHTIRRGEWRSGKASRSRLVTPIIGSRSAWEMALPAAMPDPQAGEHARADVDGDGADLAEVDAGLAAAGTRWPGSASRRGGGPRVEWIGAEHALVPADGAATCGGRRGDPEDQHQAPPVHGASDGRASGVGARRPRRTDGAEGERSGRRRRRRR